MMCCQADPATSLITHVLMEAQSTCVVASTDVQCNRWGLLQKARDRQILYLQSQGRRQDSQPVEVYRRITASIPSGCCAHHEASECIPPIEISLLDSTSWLWMLGMILITKAG